MAGGPVSQPHAYLVPSPHSWTEVTDTVEELLRGATEGQWVAAVAEWTREVHRIMPDAGEQAKEILEKSTDYRLEGVEFFMQELGTWRWHLDKLLVTGAAAGYVGQAAYEVASVDLRDTQHRVKQAQEWLSSIRASLADQEMDMDTEKEAQETSQETPLRAGSQGRCWDCPWGLRSWLWVEQPSGQSQMMASISLAKAVGSICRWMEKEAENRSWDWPKIDGKVLGSWDTWPGRRTGNAITRRSTRA
jgi:hypothetical protein